MLKNYSSDDLTIIWVKLSYILLISILLPLISFSLLCNTSLNSLFWPLQFQTASLHRNRAIMDYVRCYELCAAHNNFLKLGHHDENLVLE